MSNITFFDSDGRTSYNVGVNHPLPVTIAGGVTIDGPVTVSNEVEVKNDAGSPVPVSVIGNVALDNSTPFQVRLAAHERDTGNEPSALLAGDEVFTGTVTRLADHGGLLVLYAAFEEFTASIEWYVDETTPATGLLASTALEVRLDEPTGYYFALYPTNIPVEAYYRLKITNGPTPQTAGVLAFVAKTRDPLSGTVGLLSDDLTLTSIVHNTRAVVAGHRPDGTLGLVPTGGPRAPTPTPTPLGSGGVYLSDWFPTLGYVSIAVLIETNVVSLQEGIEVEFSRDDGTGESDGVVRRTIRRTFNTADATVGEKWFAVPNSGDHARLRYTNGGTGQANLAIEFRLNPVNVEFSRDSIAADITASNVGIMVRSIEALPNDAGSFANVTRGPAGGKRVSVKEHEAATPIGQYDSISGNATTVGTSAVQVATGAPSDMRAVLLQADPDNTKVIYVGTGSGVSSSNAPHALGAGASVVFPVGSAQALWAIASGAGQTIRWTFLRRASF